MQQFILQTQILRNRLIRDAKEDKEMQDLNVNTEKQNQAEDSSH